MTRQARFESGVMPHLDAAYNLARWLTRNDHDAEDVVQEAFMRALRYFDTMKGPDARPWLLGIVRNTCYTWLEKNRPADLVPLDDVEALASDPGAGKDIRAPVTRSTRVARARIGCSRESWKDR